MSRVKFTQKDKIVLAKRNNYSYILSMSNFWENVEKHLKSQGRTYRYLAKQLGIAESGLSMMRKGKREVTLTRMQKIADILDVSLIELLGERAKKERLPKGEGDEDSPEVITIPVYSTMMRRDGTFPGEKIAEIQAINLGVDMYALRMKDDEMGDKIPLGSFAIVAPDIPVEDGDIVAATHGESYRIRYFARVGNNRILLSAKNAKPEVLGADVEVQRVKMVTNYV